MSRYQPGLISPRHGPRDRSMLLAIAAPHLSCASATMSDEPPPPAPPPPPPPQPATTATDETRSALVHFIRHQDRVDIARAAPVLVPPIPLSDEAESLVEANRGLVVGKDVELE